jgi:hypothetical protein
MLEQGFNYVDTMMKIKKPGMRSVTLNIYGGEALYHPSIEHLLEQSSKLYEKYRKDWSLIRQLTTNASCGQDKWRNVMEHLEYITFSWHSQGPDKLQENFLRNLEITHDKRKRYQVIVLMYPARWKECTYTLSYLRKKGYNVRPRLLDGPLGVYDEHQLKDLSEMWPDDNDKLLKKIKGEMIVSKGRACCGGRPMCVNRDYKNPVTYVEREGFEGWHCSANQFFLMADSHTKNFYTNKDCHVRHDGTRGPIATIDTMDDYVSNLKETLSKTKDHFLKCVQKTCLCGTCAPKSVDKHKLSEIMKIYNT